MAASLVASAQTMPPAQTLDITWYKDGQVIDSGRHKIGGPSGASPYRHESGQSVGYATCTVVPPQQIKLTAASVFVGRSLLITPVSIDQRNVRLSVSAIDTVFDGKHTAESAGCTSEVVDVHGYTATDLHVQFTGTQTVEVPMKDPHYRLVLSLRPETL